MTKYDKNSFKAEEFINHNEILDTLEYDEKNNWKQKVHSLQPVNKIADTTKKCVRWVVDTISVIYFIKQ